MSLEQDDLKGGINFCGRSKLILSKEKFFNFHIPLTISRILDLEKGDKVQVHVNLPRKIIILKLEKGQKKEQKKERKK